MGHLIAAEWAAEDLNLHQVLIIPANLNPLKREHRPAPPEIRLKMVEAAIGNYPQLTVDDIEIRRSGVSFMIDTIDLLREKYTARENDFFLLLGADAAADFKLWWDYERLAQICTIAVFNRPGYELEVVAASLPAGAVTLKIPMVDISSTSIRHRIRAGKSIRFMTPEPVRQIIEEEGLYR